MMTMNSVAVGLSDDDGQSIEIMVINGVRKCRHLLSGLRLMRSCRSSP